MPPQSRTGLRDAVSRHLNLIFPLLIVSAVLVLVVPLPPLVMDLLLAANITVSVVILLTTIHVANPLEFSVFPAILLGTTLARLVLNVASTRLILTGAAEHGTGAAGRVIEAFGDFVAAGSPVVGLVIFLILIAIQFLVITKGATRIGEVAARFALDGMPGRQMAVDADLAAGLITREEARDQRRQISRQADFYGAMDGASKFVRGDAVAGLVITLVNILGGLAVGVLSEGMSLSQAAAVFTTLTIGDGLVAQIPAFLISVAAGLLVTRTSGDSDLSRDAVQQVFRHPVALYIAAAFLIAMAFTGLPTGPLLALGAGCAVIGIVLQSGMQVEARGGAMSDEGSGMRESESQVHPSSLIPHPSSPPLPSLHLRVEPLELELGIGLLRLADPAAGGDLLERVSQLRQRIARELGFILPKVRVRDNLRLDPRKFQIQLRGLPVAVGEAYADALLAVDVSGVEENIPGIATSEPASGAAARWIEPGLRDAAQLAGYHVHPPHDFVIQTLGEVVRSHAAELLTREQVHGLLEELRTRAPHVVDDLVPDVLKPAQVHQVLSNLLRERVPIRDLETILETLGVHGPRTHNIVRLTEEARLALRRTISRGCHDDQQRLHAVAVAPDVEALLEAHLQYDDVDLHVEAPPRIARAINRELEVRLKRLTNAGRPPVVVCRPEVRAALRRLTARAHPRLQVLSLSEVTPDTELVVHGAVELADAPEDLASRGDEPIHAARREAEMVPS
jgi:flagellar biosynthesis protein FlhA